jgi:Zn-dependent metalloprotease
MKNRLLFLFVFIFIVNGSFSQKIVTGVDAHQIIPGSKLIRYISRSIFPNHIIFANQKIQSKDNAGLLEAFLKLPKGYDLRFFKQETDNIGFIHQEYKQYYKDVPVENGVYKTHIKNGNLESINGDVYDVEGVTVIPQISSSQAILNAGSFVNADKYKWEEGKHNSLNYYPTSELVILKLENKVYLTYKVDIYSIQPLGRKFIYIDAVTGEIIFTLDRIHDIDTPGTANTAYSGSRPIIMDFNGTDYTLSEAGRGLETINSATMLQYNNSSTTWNLAGLDQYALDAHWAAEMTYDYYFNTYGRDGLDGAHYFLTSYVNEGPGFGNAFWDGATVHYGDGDGSTFTTPLTSIGIVGHEMTHGLTQFTAGLVYMNESGGMNESFSDIFGLCVDEYARSINLGISSSWLVGAECTSGSGIRNMSNPNQFGHPDTYLGTGWIPAGGGDNGGVHSNSGVQNFWFYLLTMGGAGTNDISNVYSVAGIGIDDAAAIAFRNLTFYLTPGSDYADSRYYSLIAAEDLFGPCSAEVASTADAWYAVGVGLPYQNITTSSFTNTNSVSCTTPIPVSFNNLSFNANSYLWNFGDGDTSSLQNPIHSYATAGTYNVELIATGCGTNVSDTFQTNITIATGSSTLNLDPLQPNYISCCSGTLYDSGGPSGNYTDGEAGLATIQVPAGNIVNIVFSGFDLENTFDFLTLYNGPNSSYPVIGSYTGATLPNGGLPILSTTNQVYVEFTSDAGVTATGFQFDWYCTPPAPPTSLFSSNTTTVCIGSMIEYYNNSMYADSVYWDFQGGAPLTSNADTIQIIYNVLGNYTTTLTASNILGTNSSTSTINVVPLPSPSISLAGNLASITPAFTNYQWYWNGNPVGGATSQTYTITQGGSYYCIVTDNNNCSSPSSPVVSTLSINNNVQAIVTIYPNPATSSININNATFENGYLVTITNVLGETIYSSNFFSMNASIDVSTIRVGTYFIKISDGLKEITQKIIVIR